MLTPLYHRDLGFGRPVSRILPVSQDRRTYYANVGKLTNNQDIA